MNHLISMIPVFPRRGGDEARFSVTHCRRDYIELFEHDGPLIGLSYDEARAVAWALTQLCDAHENTAGEKYRSAWVRCTECGALSHVCKCKPSTQPA